MSQGSSGRITRREGSVLYADLVVSFKMFRERFTSKVTLHPYSRIDVEYIEGPFRYLNNHWVFIPSDDGGCIIDFYVDFEFRSAILQKLIGVGGAVTAVGDARQAIFAWRGAEFTNIYEFPKRYPEAQLFKLEMNYRSTPEILGVANVSISHNRRQFPKVLQAVRRSRDFKPALVPCSDVEQQSAFIASRILELRDEGTRLEDIAVMYRSHYHSIELQLELSRRNIPYRIQSGVRFFEQAHIKDVISYLRVVVNPRDELAWKRILKLIPGVGNKTANKMKFRPLSSDEIQNGDDTAVRLGLAAMLPTVVRPALRARRGTSASRSADRAACSGRRVKA